MSKLTIGFAEHFTKGKAIVKPVKLEWDTFVEKLRVKPPIGKKSGKHFTSVTFKGDHRKEVNAQHGSVFVLDGDSSTDDTIKGAPHPQLVHDALTDLDITHFIYSSHSNVTKGHRYRVVILCDWDGKWELEAVVTWVIDKLHGEGAMLKPVAENLKMSNPWYFPSVPDKATQKAFVFLEHDGLQPFPMDDALKWWGSNPETTAKYIRPNGNGSHDPGKYEEGGRNNLLYSVGCSMRARGCSFPEILVELVTVNDTKMHPRLEDGEVTMTARSAASQPKGEAPSPVVEVQSHTYGARDSGNSPVFKKTKFSVLMATDFPDLVWNIQDIMPSGTFLLSGKPKKGKSFLAIMMAICIASGKKVFDLNTNGGSVLYLGLEDSDRRLKTRIIACAKALDIHTSKFKDNLSTATTCNTIDSGLIQQIENHMKDEPKTTVIFVDMLKKVTASRSMKDLYKEQARVGDELTQLCHRFPNLTIIVIHHNNQGNAEDPFDQVSGTTGLIGSYDQIAVITETEGDRTLHITGRDIEGAAIPLVMNDRGMYTLKMPSPEEQIEHGMSQTRRFVYDAVEIGVAVSRADIIKRCQTISKESVDAQLSNLVRDALITKEDRGMYRRTFARFYDKAVFSL